METDRTLRERGICVVIPTYNNAGTITEVVRRTMQQCRDVIVVDDGSTDATSGILARIAGITVVRCEKNRGKGHALKRGFRKALEMGFAYAITLDADGQHFPEDIPALLRANQEHPGALVVGQRMGLEKAERSAGSKFANAFSNFWFALQTGRLLKDTQTGFRLYPLRKLRGLCLLTSRYEAELELLVFSSWHGTEIVSTPVRVFYPKPAERVSHFRPFRDFARISLLNTVLCILAVGYGLPLAILRRLTAILRSAYVLLFFVCSMLVLAPAARLWLAFQKDKAKRQSGAHRLLWHYARFVILRHGIPGVPFSVGNSGGEDFARPAVIICNHQSHLDLMALLMLSPRIVCLTKDWVWHNPIYGFILRQAEFYPVSLGAEALLPRLRSLVERGYSIAIYPEGTRSADCSVSRFHQGAFHLARALRLDILPMVLYGAGKAWPKQGGLLRRWPIRIEIDRRIGPDELQALGELPRQQASALRQYYKQRYAEIANRMEQDV